MWIPGELKLIAGAGPDPLPGAENLPVIDKTYPGFTVVAFNALIAPAGTPPAVLEKLSADVRAVVTVAGVRGAHQGARHQCLGHDAEGARRLVRDRDREMGRDRQSRQPESRMMMSIKAIDCDVHPTVTDIRQLLPHLDEYWRDSVEERGIGSLETSAYPPNAPITARPDWRGENGYAATTAAELAARFSTNGTRATRSAIASMACSSSTTRTWRAPSIAR